AQTHDLIVIPGGDAHLLGSDVAAPGADLTHLVDRNSDRVPRVNHGGGGAMTRLVCGYLACDSTVFKTLLAALPRLMIINMHAAGPRGQWLESSIQFSLAEYV